MLDDIYQVSFNGNRIDLVPGVDLYNHNFTSLPQRDIKIRKLARRSLSIITSSEYTQKTIPVFVDVCSGTKQDTEATVTFLKSLLQGQNGELRVLQSNQEVIYTATMNEFNIEWNSSHAYCTIVFLASDPIGASASIITAINNTGITTSTSSSTFSVQGSFEIRPLITVNIASVTGGTGGEINLFNGITQQGINVTANFANGDTLVVDSDTLTLQLNGANLDFEGLFPVFPAGTQQIAYSDTFTTRTVDLIVTYSPRLV